jgi:hypothetical protein
MPSTSVDCCAQDARGNWGNCADATPAWFERLPRRSPEEDMLDFAFEAKPTPRLSCQIKVEPPLDGRVVRTPTYQGQ